MAISDFYQRMLNVVRRPFVPAAPLVSYQEAAPRRGTISSAGSFFGLYGSFAGFKPTPYNPDSLVQRKGLKIYRSMMTDEQVKAALLAKQYAVLSAGYDIQLPTLPEDATQEITDQAEEQKEFIKFNFEEIKGGIESKLLGIMDALAFGFSVSEKVIGNIDYGEFDGKWGLKDIKTRPPEDIQFQTDDKGDLVKNGVEQFGIGMPSSKFIIFSHRSQYGNLYGDSDLRAAYRPFWLKENMLKLMATSLERYAEPIAVATYEGLLTSDQRSDIEEFLKNLQGRSGILIPKTVTLDFKAPPPRAAEAFIPALNLYDQMIRIAILMPGLIGLSGEQQVGSLARAVKEFDAFLWILGQLRKDIETVMNEQLVKWLIDLNYEVEHGMYPKFKFNEVTEESRQKSFELFLMGLGAGGLQLGPEDQDKLRELINFEPLPADFEQIDPATGLPPGERPPPQPAFGGLGGNGNGEDQYWDNGSDGSSEFDEKALVKYIDRIRGERHAHV